MHRPILLLLLTVILTACVRNAPDNTAWTPAASPFQPLVATASSYGIPTRVGIP